MYLPGKILNLNIIPQRHMKQYLLKEISETYCKIHINEGNYWKKQWIEIPNVKDKMRQRKFNKSYKRQKETTKIQNKQKRK